MPYYPGNPEPRSYQHSQFYQPHNRSYLPYPEMKPPFKRRYQAYPEFYPAYPVSSRRRSGLHMEPVQRGQTLFLPPQENVAPSNSPLWENVNQVIGHVQELTNGINALRQIGSFFSSFR